SGVILLERNFSRFVEKIQSSSSQEHQLLIPKIVHFIWLGSSLPTKADLTIQSWQKYHPDWKIMIWTDREVANLNWTTPHSAMFY
ncbi:TcdA/TcdB catalytic glycosyltransferase domain-containing protein, partial [Staphylococcus pseudintermedius]|uniref:TcdA/TcdB catalytic glycosyltransferase domain-containing protein n=1 Tax=Staphylococcus pseudintermedius TaxID=283734 RepID=UPI0036F1CE50